MNAGFGWEHTLGPGQVNIDTLALNQAIGMKITHTPAMLVGCLDQICKYSVFYAFSTMTR
jgi:hypothetical protein